MNNLSLALARRLGIVVIASAYRTEDPGFESRQGVRFLGIYTLQCSCRSLIFIVIVCTWEKEMLNKKICRRWVCRRYFEHIFEDIYVHISLSLSLSLSLADVRCCDCVATVPMLSRKSKRRWQRSLESIFRSKVFSHFYRVTVDKILSQNCRQKWIWELATCPFEINFYLALIRCCTRSNPARILDFYLCI
jgi:hypothetical protein